MVHEKSFESSIVQEKLDIGTSPVIITSHAIDQFKKRWQPLDEYDGRPSNDEEWRKKLELLLRQSSEWEIRSAHGVQRLISNEFQDARYFYNSSRHLRFVTFEENGVFIVKTVEVPRGIQDRRGKMKKSIFKSQI